MPEMTSFERYVTVCELREPDRVPVSPLIMTFAARLAQVNYTDYCRHGEILAQAQVQCMRHFGYDSVNVTSDSVREPTTLGAEAVWPDNEVPSLGSDPFIKGPDDLHRLRLPDPLGPNLMHEQVKALQLMQQELGPDQVVYGWVESPFQEAAILRNLNHFMVDLYDRPQFVHELMRFATDMELAFGLAQIEAGARFIGMGDSVASLVSPKLYRIFNLPYVSELVAGLQKAGARVKYHACGKAGALLSAYGEVGADILNLDSLVDLSEAKQLLGSRVCLKGNLDPVGILLNGTPDEVTETSRRCIDEGGANGGFILSPGCEVPRDTPFANLEALVSAAKEYGRYPIA